MQQADEQRNTAVAVAPNRKKKKRILPAVCVSLIVLIIGTVGVLGWLDIIPVRSLFGGEVEGTAGRNLEWVIDGDTLIISGTGKMWNWEYDKPAPWFDMRDSIRHVLIKPGVSSVGTYAFVGLDNLSSMVLPSTITRIEDSPFSKTEPPKKFYYEGSVDEWEEIELPKDFPGIKPNYDTVMDDKLAYQVYLDAAEKLLASGAWSESMDTDIWLTPVDSDEGLLTTSLDYTVQISGYKKGDFSGATVSGNAHICLSGNGIVDDVTEFTFEGDNTELRYHYTQPMKSTITSYAPDDAGTLDGFFNTVNQLEQDETTFVVQSGNVIRFGINAETMKQLIGETVGQDQNVEMNFENCACTAEAKVAADGKLASLRMEFLLAMNIDGTEYSGDYSVYLWFGEYDKVEENDAAERNDVSVDIGNTDCFDSFSDVLESICNEIGFDDYTEPQKEYCRGGLFELYDRNALALMYYAKKHGELKPGFYTELWEENSDGKVSCVTRQLIREDSGIEDGVAVVCVREIDGVMYLNLSYRLVKNNVDVFKNQYYQIDTDDNVKLSYDFQSEDSVAYLSDHYMETDINSYSYQINGSDVDRATFYDTQDKMNYNNLILWLSADKTEMGFPGGDRFDKLFSQTVSDLSTYTGKWEIDFDTTESQTGVSAMDLFGSSYAAGSGLIIGGESEFSYYFPIGGSFLGSCTWENGLISYSVIFEETNTTKNGELIPEIVNGETFLTMKVSNNILYWKRVES